MKSVQNARQKKRIIKDEKKKNKKQMKKAKRVKS